MDSHAHTSQHIMNVRACLSDRVFYTSGNYDLLIGAACSSLACSVTSSRIVAASVCLSSNALHATCTTTFSLAPHIVDSLAVPPTGGTCFQLPPESRCVHHRRSAPETVKQPLASGRLEPATFPLDAHAIPLLWHLPKGSSLRSLFAPSLPCWSAFGQDSW